MDFVDDVDFERAAGGRIADIVPEFPDMIDARIGRGIDLQDVEVVSPHDFEAGIALVARLAGGPFRAVQGLGHDARGGGFAGAARADKKIGVGHAVGLDGVFERLRDMRLPHHLVKLLRPPFSR